METVTELKRNSLSLQMQVLSSALLMLIIGLIVSWLLTKLFSWTENSGAVAQSIVWIFLFFMWIVASLKLWFNWRVKRYEVGNDTLIVHARMGTFGSTQTVYRYESIISLRMTQGFLGKRFGYGDIRITMPKLEHELILNDIDQPTEQLKQIRERMDARSGDSYTSTLIT